MNESGHFLITLDTELAWGHFDIDDVRSRIFAGGGDFVRENVERLLDLFNEFGIIGTWAVVGHLFYDQCEECEICPVLTWEGKYKSFQEVYRTADRRWYGTDLVKKILSSPLSQEIGFHGYTHRVFDETHMTVEDARTEVKEWLRVASKWGVGPGAVVFPRNQVGHLAVFEELGFVCYRGVEVAPARWKFLDEAGPLAVLSPLRLYLSTPMVYDPKLNRVGMVDLPASRWIGSDHRLERSTGLDRLFAMRLARVAEALKVAVQENKVVHVYLHPYELQKESDFEMIRELLSFVGDLVADGSIHSVGMAQLARRLLPALDKREDHTKSIE